MFIISLEINLNPTYSKISQAYVSKKQLKYLKQVSFQGAGQGIPEFGPI